MDDEWQEDKPRRQKRRAALNSRFSGTSDVFQRQRRKRDDTSRITDKKKCQVSFSKRRKTLYRRAMDLSLGCNARVSIAVISGTDRIYRYDSHAYPLWDSAALLGAKEYLSNDDYDRITKESQDTSEWIGEFPKKEVPAIPYPPPQPPREPPLPPPGDPPFINPSPQLPVLLPQTMFRAPTGLPRSVSSQNIPNLPRYNPALNAGNEPKPEDKAILPNGLGNSHSAESAEWRPELSNSSNPAMLSTLPSVPSIVLSPSIPSISSVNSSHLVPQRVSMHGVSSYLIPPLPVQMVFPNMQPQYAVSPQLQYELMNNQALVSPMMPLQAAMQNISNGMMMNHSPSLPFGINAIQAQMGMIMGNANPAANSNPFYPNQMHGSTGSLGTPPAPANLTLPGPALTLEQPKSE